MRADSEVADRVGPCTEELRRDVGDDLVDQPGAQEGGRELRTALEEHVLPPALVQHGQRLARGRGSPGARSRPGRRTPADRGQVDAGPSPLAAAGGAAGRRTRLARSAAGRRPRPCRCRPASRRTGRAGGGCPRRAAFEVIHRLVPSAAALRPSSVVASFQVTKGRRCSIANVHARFNARDSRSISPKATSMPAARRATAPPAATGLGSGWANTTRATPASIRASEQGPVRPVWWHGSSVTTAVAPRAASPASRQRSSLGVGRPRAAVVALRDLGHRPGTAARSRRAGSGRGVRRECARARARAASRAAPLR